MSHCRDVWNRGLRHSQHCDPACFCNVILSERELSPRSERDAKDLDNMGSHDIFKILRSPSSRCARSGFTHDDIPKQSSLRAKTVWEKPDSVLRL